MTSPRIIGHMVTRNEMDRYLPATVEWLSTLADDIFVYDDCSTDGTAEFLHDAGVSTISREPRESSFLANEGVFRMMAWRAMETKVAPTGRDWILCVDADELLLASDAVYDPCEVLREEVRAATAAGIDTIAFDVAEAFGIVEGCPQIRTDGYWGRIRACRLVRWRDHGLFATRDACGSVPNAWASEEYVSVDLTLLHLGYVRPADRRTKYDRYIGGAGHNRYHVESIMKPTSLASWTGQPLPVDVST